MASKMVKALCALLIAVFIFPALPGTLIPEVRAASNAPLDGIDYDRLTQKAMIEMSDFVAKMKIGDVEIKGKLKGSEGFTMAEINEVVEEVLSSMSLDLEEVGVLSALGEDLERRQWIEIGKKVAVALSEYVPSSPDSPVSPTDVVKFVLYGENPVFALPQSRIEGELKESAKNKIADGLQKLSGKMGGKVPKSGGKLGLAGFALDSISAGKDLADSKEFDEFCKRLEDEYSKISEFYSRCSRKLNDLAELKNFGRGSIVFDELSTGFDEVTLLGVDGVKMRYRLTGILKKQVGEDETVVAGDNSGAYEGDLKLEIEGYGLDECFDAVFADKSTLWKGINHVNDWSQILYRFEGAPSTYRENLLNKFIFTVNRPTYLKRTLVGHFRVYIPIPKIKGTVTPVLSGSFDSVSDGIDFLFRMNFGHEFKAHASKPGPYGPIDLGVPVQQWHVETFLQGVKSVDALHCTWVGNEAAREYFKDSVGIVMYGGAGQDIVLTKSDFGTPFRQLEKAPVLEISEFG